MRKTTNISQYLNPNHQVSSQMHTYSKYHSTYAPTRHTPDWYRKHHVPDEHGDD